MNKNIIILYEDVLRKVLDEFGISQKEMFYSNEAECVQARMALIVALTDIGLSDKEIAECTKKMRRCSICKIRNRYRDADAPWTVKMCIDKIKGS